MTDGGADELSGMVAVTGGQELGQIGGGVGQGGDDVPGVGWFYPGGWWHGMPASVPRL